ncbi:MAG: beta-N-acetylglucosaminidase domain-containing protein [Spongiibacteraceae bacterium]
MSEFFYGVIEGFYGHQWSWQQRKEYAQFLKRHGFDAYIYAPKADVFFRGRWREQHAAEQWQQLQALGQHYQLSGVRWGLGLSPLGLSVNYTAEDKRLLQDKVQRINELSPNILCVLFDDIRGDIDGLGQRQLEITADIIDVSLAQQHIICPTYYSTDPVLEQVFGIMPCGYMETLGQGLAAEVDVFWTGSEVIAKSFSRDDLEPVENLFKRKPVLWDNYPVNDGRLTSNYLHLRPYQGRPCEIDRWCRGHVVNPMNQPLLSQLVLQSLQSIYQQRCRYNVANELEEGLAILDDAVLATQLSDDVVLFHDLGLSAMTEAQRLEKSKLYRAFDHPVASEVADWLDGYYLFDPNCLTG